MYLTWLFILEVVSGSCRRLQLPYGLSLPTAAAGPWWPGQYQPSCGNCRTRKTRCDREKPACSTCLKRGVMCVYKEKTETDAESTEVLEALQSMSHREALETLRALRSTRDTAAALNVIRNKREPVHDHVEHNHGLGIGVAAQSPLEQELISCYPKAYAPILGVSASPPVESHLVRPVNRTCTRMPSPSPQAEARDGVAMLSPVQQPYYDDRLRYLNIIIWTDVPIANDFAARVLSLYLATDHPLLGLFDPYLFVTDLVNGGHVYCSRFLVHVLLYWGCQMYTAIDKSAHKLVNVFWEETKRLWLAEKVSGAHLDTLLNMAAAQLLSLACMGHGRDGDVLDYLNEGVQIGTRLRLLGVDEATARDNARSIPDSMLSTSSYAAWGVFNWAVLCSIFHRQPGLEYPKFPPVLPTPGELRIRTDPDIFGQAANPPLPPYEGETFSALSTDPHYPPQLTKLEFAEFKYRELLVWAENLPASLVRGEDSPHHVVILHMWFHCVIVDIFLPFIESHALTPDRLKTFTCMGPPKAAYSASIEQLKSLIVLYRSKYEASTYTILWHTALINVANAVLQDTANPESRVYFLICIYGYEALNRPYRMSAVVGQSLLTMALREGNISSQEAREIVAQLRRRGLSPQRADVRATFVVDLKLAMTDTEAARVENLAARFEEMAFFQELIHLDGDSGAMDLA
ncbi:hypothetical protein GGS20DRAFT_577389 [Poronia punctata]|nr:hypothetical protein GGS20DRAFT_577389 [Poronia punctata]